MSIPYPLIRLVPIPLWLPTRRSETNYLFYKLPTKTKRMKKLLLNVVMCVLAMAGSTRAWAAPLNEYTTIDLEDATTYSAKL